MKKNKAVFLDRDGTIIRQVNDLQHAKDIRLLPFAAEGIRALNKIGFKTLVHTNQPVVARGWLSEEKLTELHNVLLERLKKRGAHIDKVYYCPHHPNADLKKYRKVCSCRKPNIGLLEMGAKQYNIDMKKSFMVGDHSRDIMAGNKAGLTTILLVGGQAGGDDLYDARPDYRVKNLYMASKLIRRLAN